MPALAHDVALENSYIDLPIVRRASANGRPFGGTRFDGKSVIVSLDTASIVNQLSFDTLQGTAPQLARQHIVILVDGLAQRAVAVRSFESKADVAKNVNSVELVEQLDFLKDHLGLSVTQMAELFSVTRKSIYDWYEGTIPRVEKLNKAHTLVQVVSELQKVDVRRLKTVWNIKRNGQSFLDILGSDEINNADLQTALRSKLDELSSQMVTTASLVTRTQNRKIDIGESHMAEFDRRGDFS
jgi:predicted DNA-binding protein YlxM (UPF0122 family)